MFTFGSKFLTFPFCDSKHVALFIFWLWFFDEDFQYQWIVRSWRQWQEIRTSSGGIFYVARNGLHRYQCYCSHMMTKKWQKHTVVVKCERTLPSQQVSAKPLLESSYKSIWTNTHLYGLLGVQSKIYLRLIAFGWLCFLLDIPDWNFCLQFVKTHMHTTQID